MLEEKVKYSIFLFFFFAVSKIVLFLNILPILTFMNIGKCAIEFIIKQRLKKILWRCQWLRKYEIYWLFTFYMIVDFVRKIIHILNEKKLFTKKYIYIKKKRRLWYKNKKGTWLAFIKISRNVRSCVRSCSKAQSWGKIFSCMKLLELKLSSQWEEAELL